MTIKVVIASEAKQPPFSLVELIHRDNAVEERAEVGISVQAQIRDNDLVDAVLLVGCH
jgi:hypothetical protein